MTESRQRRNANYKFLSTTTAWMKPEEEKVKPRCSVKWGQCFYAKPDGSGATAGGAESLCERRLWCWQEPLVTHPVELEPRPSCCCVIGVNFKLGKKKTPPLFLKWLPWWEETGIKGVCGGSIKCNCHGFSCLLEFCPWMPTVSRYETTKPSSSLGSEDALVTNSHIIRHVHFISSKELTLWYLSMSVIEFKKSWSILDLLLYHDFISIWFGLWNDKTFFDLYKNP